MPLMISTVAMEGVPFTAPIGHWWHGHLLGQVEKHVVVRSLGDHGGSGVSHFLMVNTQSIFEVM